MKKTSQLIQGTSGAIEIRAHKASSEFAEKLVVLSHPHPLYGGTMDNKVVTTMERAFRSLGFHTVAFNFRGVGESQGEYDNGEGEQQDLKAVIEWARLHFNTDDVVLAGFSFGSYVILKGLPLYSNVHSICTVAPPVGLYDFSTVNACNVNWSLVQGGQDEVIDAQEVLGWALSCQPQPDLYWRAGASHFFHGELVWLKKLITSIYS